MGADNTPRAEIPSGQCHNCGAPLASDQRYCLSCGERRGKARFALGGAASPPPAPAAVVRETRPRGTRVNAGVAFVGFVAVLLLAMGVGVLIGHTNNPPVQRASAPGVSVVSVNGGGSGGGFNSNSGSGNNSSGKKGKTKVAQVNKPKPLAKKVIVKAQKAAASVLGGNNLPPPTVTLGQKGSGPGFENGHFTGNFFGSP